MSTGRFVALVALVVVIVLAGFGSVVGLELAGRPVATVLELYGGLMVTTIPSIAALAVARDTNHTIKNGLPGAIADETAKRVAGDAAVVAATLLTTPAPPPA